MTKIPYGYCVCGCGQKTRIAPQSHTKKGWTKGEPQPYMHGHGTRLAQFYEVAKNGCWIVPQNVPYPTIYRGGKHQLAGRYFYEQAKGPIPEGLQLDHRCRNTKCVNPNHVEPVSPAVNCQRRPTTKLTPEDVKMIRKLKTNHRQTGLRFGVSGSHIAEIRAGRARRNG